jgi:Spy/CpxP family protein refolding chaperone
MRIWVSVFTLAIFAGGTCLGVALSPQVRAAAPAPADAWGTKFPELSVSRFSEKLDLSADQDSELEVILDETRRDIEAYARAMRSAHDRSRDRVMTILTDDQKKRLDQLLDEERRGRADSEVARTLRAYSRFLSLSEAQVEPVRGILSEFRQKKRDFFARGDRGGDRTQFRAHLRSLREETNRRMEAILSPEQYGRYVELQELER